MLLTSGVLMKALATVGMPLLPMLTSALTSRLLNFTSTLDSSTPTLQTEQQPAKGQSTGCSTRANCPKGSCRPLGQPQMPLNAVQAPHVSQQPVSTSSCQQPRLHGVAMRYSYSRYTKLLLVHPLPDFAQQLLIVLLLRLKSLIKQSPTKLRVNLHRQGLTGGWG